MEKFTIYCTKGQVRKALKLGLKLDDLQYADICDEKIIKLLEEDGFEYYYRIPTGEQMINWIEKQGVNITISNAGDYSCDIWYHTSDGPKYIKNFKKFSTRKMATLAAINAALDYLINNKK